MKPEIIQNGEFIEVIGHYDDEVKCAKMTLLAELYAVEHRDGYAKFRLEDADKLGLVNERLEFVGGNIWFYGLGLGIDIFVVREDMVTDANIGQLASNETSYWTATGGTPYMLTYVNGDSSKPITDIGYKVKRVYDETKSIEMSHDDYRIFITDSPENQDYIRIELEASTPRVTIDLTTLSGWSGLSDGSHSITVKAKATGYRDSEASQAVSVTKAPTWQMTVANLGSSSPSSVTFTTNQGVFPTFDTVTQDGVDFIKIPTMYRKVLTVSSNQITSFSISNKKIDSYFKPYSVFINENGNLLPYILIGKSWLNTYTTLENGRTQAKAKGTGYQLYDWQFHKLWQDLICAKMQTIDVNNGSGITTDTLGLSWGETFLWIDGVSYQSSTHGWAVSYKPSKYVNEATGSTDGYVVVGYTSSGTTSAREVSKLGYDTSNEFVNYPIGTISNDDYNTYYCDKFEFSSSNSTHPIYCITGSPYAANGAFRYDATVAWSSSKAVRLCYRPVAE